jgi:DNA-binding response OmpR family regulator
VVKPFSMAELLARVRVVLRRAGRLRSPTWTLRDVVVDEQNRTVVRADHPVDLTPTEFDLLMVLAHNPGKVHSKTQLLAEIWGFDVSDPNVVEVCISSLRRKLEVHGPRLIFTQWGRGYFLRP